MLNKQKVVVAHAASPYKHSLRDVLDSPGIASRIKARTLRFLVTSIFLPLGGDFYFINSGSYDVGTFLIFDNYSQGMPTRCMLCSIGKGSSRLTRIPCRPDQLSMHAAERCVHACACMESMR